MSARKEPGLLIAAAQSPPRHPAWIEHAAFAAVVATFGLLTAFTLLTFPPFYEDESWTFLAVFEALRGNGLSWAAFGEGRPIPGVFLALVTPVTAVLPATPEGAIRIVSGMWGVCCLAGAYLLGRRWSPSTAWVAPALMLSTQYVFVALRYGRTDGAALAFALWSLVAASRQRPFRAGVLFGLAVSVHPVFVWIAASCVWLLGINDRRRVASLLFGSAIGAAPQIAWTLTNWSDIQEIGRRYAVSSSVVADVSGGVLKSIATEPERYVTYLTAQPTWHQFAQLVAYMALPLTGVALVKTWRTTAALVVPSIVGLAVLAQNKNPYYLFTVLPFVAVATAIAVHSLPRAAQLLSIGFISLMAVVSVAQFATAGWTARDTITAAAATAALAEALPAGATIIAPNLYAGVIRRRPDVQFFNYHALSTRPGWGLPSCDLLPAVIQGLAARDPRATRRRRNSVAFMVAPSASALTAYLQQIYVKSTAADARCLLGAPDNASEQLPVCNDSAKPCDALTIATIELPNH